MDMDNSSAAFVEAITQLARSSQQPFPHPQGGIALMRPDGIVQHLPAIDALLTHVKQNVAAYDAKAFIDYVNRFKQTMAHVTDTDRPLPKTTIFANPQTAALKAIIDYHTNVWPDHCHHAIEFAVPRSEQWNRWSSIDGKALPQIAFAEFIEENTADIVEPAAATFLDLVTGLQAKKAVSFESGVRLQDGSNQLVFAESIEAKGRGTMTIPSEFAIGVPVFLNGEAYKVKCLLRYRIHEGALTFTVKIHRRQFLEHTAFGDVCEVVAAGTELPVMNAWTK